MRLGNQFSDLDSPTKTKRYQAHCKGLSATRLSIISGNASTRKWFSDSACEFAFMIRYQGTLNTNIVRVMKRMVESGCRVIWSSMQVSSPSMAKYREIVSIKWPWSQLSYYEYSHLLHTTQRMGFNKRPASSTSLETHEPKSILGKHGLKLTACFFRQTTCSICNQEV